MAKRYIKEVEERDLGFTDPSKDDFTKRYLDDTRKPKLTLKLLNKLKKIRATRQLEQLKRNDLLQTMYGLPEEGEDDMMG